jgi:peroxiredoxin Q/BCP
MLTGLETGAEAPEFCLPDQSGEEVCLESLRGRWVVLYFYPKDNTKGCTLEAIDFTMNKERIEGMGATVLGVAGSSSASSGALSSSTPRGASPTHGRG